MCISTQIKDPEQNVCETIIINHSQNLNNNNTLAHNYTYYTLFSV